MNKKVGQYESNSEVKKNKIQISIDIQQFQI